METTHPQILPSINGPHLLRTPEPKTLRKYALRTHATRGVRRWAFGYVVGRAGVHHKPHDSTLGRREQCMYSNVPPYAPRLWNVLLGTFAWRVRLSSGLQIFPQLSIVCFFVVFFYSPTRVWYIDETEIQLAIYLSAVCAHRESGALMSIVIYGQNLSSFWFCNFSCFGRIDYYGNHEKKLWQKYTMVVYPKGSSLPEFHHFCIILNMF